MNTTFLVADMVLAFIISAVFAGFIIPQILLIAFRKQLFDVPDERKIHTSAVPRLGGIAFMLVTMFTVMLIIGVNLALEETAICVDIIDNILYFCFGFCALVLIYVVGIADDLIGVRYRAKFVVQALSAFLIVASGLYIGDLHGLMFVHTLPPIVGYILTVIVIVFITNSINLIDGIDGLASGLCMVALLYYCIVFFTFGHYTYALISAALFGTVVPFFYYNVFGRAEKQKKIFMGDTGALTLGVMISFLSLRINQFGSDSNVNNAFVIAFAPLIVPCFDVIRVYFHRIREHKSPFLPDKNHIHHKLMRAGLTPGWAMIAIIMFSIIVTVLNLALSFILNLTLLMLLDLLCYFAGHEVLNKYIARRNEKTIA